MQIKKFKNYYCDALYCALSEFLPYETIEQAKLSEEEQKTVCEYAVVKNLMNGIGQLYIKVPKYGLGLAFLDKYNLQGKEIVSSEEIDLLPTSAMVGDRLIIEISSIEDEIDNLSKIADFVGRCDGQVLIKVGRDLDEVGRIVNKFNMSPIETLESFGFLDRKCYCYGLNFIDKDDQKLLKDYNVTCIFSPRNDGYEGKGSINLYNFVYNELKFGFSSGKCYNIDMLGEVRLAKFNTSNLMYDSMLLETDELLEKLSAQQTMEIDFDELERKENIFDKSVLIEHEKYQELRAKIKEIVKRIKEN